MSKETVRVPDIGGVDAAEVVEVLVAVGDDVELEQGLVVLESDKASLEIPSTAAGRVVELLASEGQELAEGDPVAVIESAGDGAGDDASDSAGAADDAASGTGDDGSASNESDEGDQSDRDGKDDKGEGSDAATEEDGDSDHRDDGDDSAENDDSDAAQERASGSAQTVTVVVPDIGTDDAVDVVEVSVAEGDSVGEGDSLIVLESDKASMEVPSTAAGTVRKVFAVEGKQLKQGDPVVELETAGQEKAAEKPEQKSEQKPQQKPAGDDRQSAPQQDESDKGAGSEKKGAASGAPATADGQSGDAAAADAAANTSYAGPAVRRLAREFGVPLHQVSGSGPRGRILKEDLHQFVQRALDTEKSTGGGAGLPQVPEIDFAKFGPVDVSKRSKIDRLTANNMQRSWLNVPHVTQFDDVDITDLEAFRKGLREEADSRGTKLTPMAFMLKACAVALKRHEKINASLSDGGETLTFKRYVHIGMAVDTPAGLVVPVLRDVDRKTLWELAAEVMDLAGRARDRKLRPEEMQGAGFTISSLGGLGGRGFTPIVNTPEVAILGVGRAQMQPLWDGTAFQPRLQMPVSLSYDHRVVNGGDAGRFLTDLKALLEDLRRQLL